MATLVDTQVKIDEAIMKGANVIIQEFENAKIPDDIETLCCSLEYLSKAFRNIRDI
jgi:hypothetical protein